MNSQQELEFFKSIPDNIKRNYRVIKCLLKDKVPSSYILKTAFIHLKNQRPLSSFENGPVMLKLMIEFLRDKFSAGYLGAYHNQRENLLERHSSRLSKLYGYFKRLSNKEIEDVIKELYD